VKYFLDLNLGLGDLLLCNGLIRYLISQKIYELQIPCYPHNLKSAIAIFEDLIQDKSLEIVPHDCIRTFPSIHLGQRGRNFDPNRWDESFYVQAEVPFIEKWRSFSVPRKFDYASFYQLDGKYDGDRIKFIHDDSSRGFDIPIKGFRPEKTDSILDHVKTLCEAGEFHCINSSFAILIDQMGFIGKKYLHRYARRDGCALPIFGQRWQILDRPL